MKRRVLMIAVTAVLLAGCGGRVAYKNPNASQAQQEQDYRECDFEAAKATGNLADKGDREDRMKDLVDKCMRARGYTPN